LGTCVRLFALYTVHQKGVLLFAFLPVPGIAGAVAATAAGLPREPPLRLQLAEGFLQPLPAQAGVGDQSVKAGVAAAVALFVQQRETHAARRV
jgi:hypothetical protein